MNSYFAGVGLMFLGGLLAVVWRSRLHAGNHWQFSIFWKDNLLRFIIIGLIDLLVPLAVNLEPRIIDAFISLGWVPSAFGLLGIGLFCGYSVIKLEVAPTMTTVARYLEGGEE